MKANLNRTVEIKEKEKGHYHTLMTRIKVNPLNPKIPERLIWVKAWRYEDFKKYFLDASPEAQIKYRQAMNVDEIEIVHDPSITEKVAAPEPGPVTIKRVGKPVGRARR